ncbi:MAG TPA: ABC transporter permease, partial [Dehalococcoidia bacterium]|nr:ABC transporter permease [Dehalococcoidia bacterium]
FGLAIRAVVDSETMSALVGTNTSLVAASSWAMGAVLAGLAGILISPILNLSAINFALLVVASFAAVVIARLNSLTLAFAGALLLGLIQQVSVKYLPTEGVLASGFRPSVPFFVMAVFLLLYSFGGWGREPSHDERHHATAEPTSAPEPARGWLVRIGYPVAGAIVVLGLPAILDSFWMGIVVSGLALAVIFLSYTLVTGEAGIVSLCQVTFAGIGAVAAAQLSTEYDWPVALAMLGGGVAAVPFGIVVAGLAVRLEGLYLALATLAFALLMDNLVFPIERFSQHASGVAMDRPAIGGYAFDTDVRYYYLLLAIFGALALFITSLRRSTTGLLWGALRSAETAAATLGYSIVRSKLTAFALSAFIAGLGGSLLAGYTLRAHPPSFNALIGLTWLAVVVMWGVRGSMGAMAAGLMFMVLPQLATDYLPDELHQMPPLFFGLGAIALAREPRGIVVLLANGLRSVRRVLSGRESPPALAQEG